MSSPLKGRAVEAEIQRATADTKDAGMSGEPQAEAVQSRVQIETLRVPGIAPARAPGKAVAGGNKNGVAAINEGRMEDTRRLFSKLFRELGPIAKILEDPLVSDIYRNPDGKLWVTKIGEETRFLEYAMSDDVAMALIGTVSSYMRSPVNTSSPRLEGTLPHDQSRFSAIIPPAANGGPMFSIRKRAVLQRTFDDYIDAGSMTAAEAAFIRKRIFARDNILIVGATGSGKTTLGNAILREMSYSAAPSERFFLIEDVAELQCYAPQTIPLLTTATLTMNDLLKAIMRHGPTRICVGEIRGAEAHTLIKALNTGHDGGLTTIHSGSVNGALIRLEDLIREAGVEPSKQQIAASIQLVVVMERDPKTKKRRIKELLRITGASISNYAFSKI